MNVGRGIGAAGLGRALGATTLPNELKKVLAAAEQGRGLEGSMREAARAIEQAFGPLMGGAAATAGQNVGGESIEKLLYLSVLRAAMQKATESKSFNIETHINDLWVKLSQVRQHKSHEGLQKMQQLAATQGQMQQMMSNIVRSYRDAAMNVIQNIR